MAGLCEGGNEPSGSLKAIWCTQASFSYVRVEVLLNWFILRRFINCDGYVASERDVGDNAKEMGPGSSAESYPAFALNVLRENPKENINQGKLGSVGQSGMLDTLYTPWLLPSMTSSRMWCPQVASEIWSLKKKDVNRIKATEMKFLRRTAGYTILDRKRNEEILEQLEVESVEEKISRYKFNWLDHVRRMENSRIPKIMMQYKPRGHRRPGRPLRRLLDGAETGLQRPNS
ncbi:hypothetical protein ANN_00339 [Periplaneta americana]|uniref:Uncharacterized protein n=1 Tax=Periplaneta americana TaxID=6978 RepID=A0ABQ8TQN1_PERAM|nr:hypothetical protein ANN_00339 [Periplaneta americana]